MFPVMKHDSRFELRLSEVQRRELSELAAEIGISATALSRLAVKWLLANRAVLQRGPMAPRKERTPA
jgi:hypothetical protein